MKKITIKKILASLAFIFVAFTTSAQIQSAGIWAGVGDVNISKEINDADNGDGAADGALYVDGTSATVGQGIIFTFDGTMQEGSVYGIETTIYNPNASFCGVQVYLYNKTDDTVLGTAADSNLGGSDVDAITIANYTALATDAGDVLELRFIRDDDGNTARNFSVDIVKLNGATFGARTVVFFEDFRYASTARGFLRAVSNDGGHDAASSIITRVSDVADAADTNGLFDPTVDRPLNLVPDNTPVNSDFRAISTDGDNNSTNYAVDAYAVFNEIDLTSANALINPSDDYVYASFWTQSRDARGDIATYTILATTGYTGDPDTTTWDTLSLHSGKFGSEADNLVYVKGMVDLSAYTGSATLTLALRYQGSAVAYTATERNGVLRFSDLQFITQSTPITNVWDGSTDSDLSKEANWSTKAAPVSTSNNLIIPGGLTNYPTATAALTVNNLTLESGSSFITNSTVTGNVTSKRNLSVADKWHLVSSPVSGEIMTDMRANNSFADNGTKVSFAPYDNSQADSDNRWAYFGNTATNPLVDGAGYSTKLTTVGDISFTGTLNTSDFTSLSLTDNSAGTGNAFNLMGNPYASYVSLTSLLTANDSGGNNLLTESTIWIWDQVDSEYDTYNSGDSFQIAPNQGFFVSADGAASTFTITEAMQSHQTTNTFQKSAGKTQIKLFVSDGKLSKKTKIYYLEGSSTDFDNGYDSSVFGGVTNSFEISSELVSNNKGKKLAIQSLPKSDIETMIIPISLVVDSGKEISFSAQVLNLPTNLKVYLEDRLTNTFTRLDETASSLKVLLNEPLNGAGRFFVHTKSSALNIDKNQLNNVSVFKTSNSILRITGLTQGNANIRLYNILGKQVMNSSFKSKGTLNISLPKLSSGVYIVQLTAETGKLNKKIILE